VFLFNSILKQIYDSLDIWYSYLMITKLFKLCRNILIVEVYGKTS